jgi:membrane fusion protein, peptide pheromone/bacteriocin exporter
MKVFPRYSAIDFENQRSRIGLSTWSNAIYLTFCFAIPGFLWLSFLLTIDISISSPGFIRSTAEITPVRSLVSGRIKELMLYENKFVHKGDVLCSIGSEVYDSKETYLAARNNELRHFIHDLRILTSTETNVKSLRTSLYQQAGITYQKQLMEALNRYKKTELEFNRNQILHQEQVIADAEFEDFRFKLDQAELALTLLKQTQLSQWQSQLSNHTAELLRIESDQEQLVNEKNNLTIRSPITGYVQNLAGIYRGSLVYPNEELALISPDTSLIAEVLVSPNDIGLLRFQMPVKFQIDAFNYSDWGLASGRILEISNDVHVLDGKPVFKIKCALAENFLELKNGYRGYLKKGMTMKARFIVTQRTLWQLLYDKVEDWLNPNAAS